MTRRSVPVRWRVAGSLLVAGLFWRPSTAGAQIYSWRDARGTLVLSDRPRDPAAVTYPVNPHGTVQATREAVRAEPLTVDHLIERHARIHGVRPDLVRAIIQVESGFDAGARSPKGAMGLMQLMPSTAAELGVTNAFDPAENIRGGVTYLRQLLNRYDGDETLALAAYNAGPASVERHGGQVPPYRETQDYVLKIAGVAPVPVGTRIYKSVELIDGRPVPKYSNVRPASNGHEVVASKR